MHGCLETLDWPEELSSKQPHIIIERIKTRILLLVSGILKKESELLYWVIISRKLNELSNEKIFTPGAPKTDKKIRNIDIVKKNNLALIILKSILAIIAQKIIWLYAVILIWIILLLM